MRDMNENPVSVEEFEAMNPALVGAMRNAVRRGGTLACGRREITGPWPS